MDSELGGMQPEVGDIDDDEGSERFVESAVRWWDEAVELMREGLER